MDSFNFASYDAATRLRSLLTDVLLPTVLAVPLLLFFTSKLRDLAIAHETLTIYASTDSLTQVMNRGAFSTLVEVLKKCGDDLTRENLMKQAASLNNLQLPLALPGVTISTSADDYAPFQSMQLMKFDGKEWVRFGEVLKGR